MGKNHRPQIDQIRALLTSGAQIAMIPQVQEAMENLLNAIADVTADPGLQVAALTTWAASKGAAQAVPGLETEAEAMQISLLRSIYATHMMNTRTLH